MRICPVCEVNKPDTAFWDRKFNRMKPICSSPCWDHWRSRQLEIREWGIVDRGYAPWQLGQKETKKRTKAKLSPFEKLHNPLPVNPTWVGR